MKGPALTAAHSRCTLTARWGRRRWHWEHHPCVAFCLLIRQLPRPTIHSFIHQQEFTERLLCTRHILGTEDAAATRTDKIPQPQGADSLEEETDKIWGLEEQGRGREGS